MSLVARAKKIVLIIISDKYYLLDGHSSISTTRKKRQLRLRAAKRSIWMDDSSLSSLHLLTPYDEGVSGEIKRRLELTRHRLLTRKISRNGKHPKNKMQTLLILSMIPVVKKRRKGLGRNGKQTVPDSSVAIRRQKTVDPKPARNLVQPLLKLSERQWLSFLAKERKSFSKPALLFVLALPRVSFVIHFFFAERCSRTRCYQFCILLRVAQRVDSKTTGGMRYVHRERITGQSSSCWMAPTSYSPHMSHREPCAAAETYLTNRMTPSSRKTRSKRLKPG